VAPPVGDIAVAPIDITPDTIDLGTAERVPKLLLREAPVREVLTLLARAAGLNVAFTEGSGGTTTGAPGEAAPSSGGATVSLDVENESVQDVFNYVLRLSGLQASRVGQTIFVGQTLPGGAQNRIVRTFRLNQIRATASGTIVQNISATASTGGSVSGSSSSVGGGSSSISGSSASLATSTINRQTTTNQNITDRGALEILQSYGANGGATSGDARGSSTNATLLQGLEVIADARANSVTLIGSPRVVEIATGLLQQMDLRRRQAAVGVKVVDVNLTKSRNANASLQFGSGVATGETLAASFINGIFRIGAPIGTDFLLNLVGSIRDRNAKILTSPTLMIQEGSSSQVNLTQEVFSGFITNPSIVDPTTGVLVPGGREPIIRQAGVIVNITIDRIDDNGFITLNISPEVSAPGDTFIDNGSEATLLTQRRLETGQIRLRDGQTLLLTGIIQDSDTSSVDKVPILGDIPLLGRLFRRDVKSRIRNELVVIVTPKILNDSDQSSFGYQYNPSPETEKLLNR
jgi:type IV pilus assembly protein PilQ